MKGSMKKELLEILLVVIIIVATYFMAAPLFAATTQSTSESFRMLSNHLEEFINEKETVSVPTPYFIDQGFFLMVCESSTLCICGKDRCNEKGPMSSHKFDGYIIDVIGNKKLNGKYAITEDPGILASHRGVQNIIFKKATPEDKTIQIIDCSTKEAKRTYGNECTGKVS